MYPPLNIGGSQSRRSVMGTMPVRGTDLVTFPQLLDASRAYWIENYWLDGMGRMVKRKGTTENFDTTESDEITLWKNYRNDYQIVAYGQKVRAYDKVNKTFTDIKTDFTASNGGFSGDRYGDYFFITNKLDGLYRISRTITYSQLQNNSGQNKFTVTSSGGTPATSLTGGTSGAVASIVSQSSSGTTWTIICTITSGTFQHGEVITSGTLAGANLSNINPFTVSQKVTGQTSGAKGIILEHTDDGATGTLTLGEISGTFQNGEVLLDDANGSYPGRGTSTSTLGFSITSVSAAPKARFCRVIKDRLLLWQLSTNGSGWAYSGRDTGTNPTFTNFTTGTGFNDPGDGYFRNGGDALTADMIGDVIMLGFEKGWHAFQITQTEISGVISKYDQEINTSMNQGIRKLFACQVGMIACGDFGVRVMTSIGQSNVPYSEQWETLTESLGDYFDDVDFTNSDITYHASRGYVYISCAKGGGTTNNTILAIKAELPGVETDVKTGAVSIFSGLNPLGFLTEEDDIYFTSSIDGKTYHLFDGENDNGNEIYAEYAQELNFESISDHFNLDEFRCAGELSSASSITVYFDTFDLNGYFEEDRRNYTWTASNSYTGGGGWGGARWGSSGWGSGGTASGLIYSKARMQVKLRNLHRVRVRFVSSDTADHSLALFAAAASVVAPTRNNTLAAN